MVARELDQPALSIANTEISKFTASQTPHARVLRLQRVSPATLDGQNGDALGLYGSRQHIPPLPETGITTPLEASLVDTSCLVEETLPEASLQEKGVTKVKPQVFPNGGVLRDVYVDKKHHRRSKQNYGGELYERLTERETEVLKRVATGMTDGQIAGDLHLSEQTIRNYVSNIFGKMFVSTRIALIKRGIEEGYVDRPSLPTDFDLPRIHILTPAKRRAYDMLVSTDAPETLFLGDHTMRNYASAIYRELGVSGRVELFLFHLARQAWEQNPQREAIELTPTQTTQLRMMADGTDYTSIAEKLGMNSDEVSRNKGVIYDRFFATSRVKAVLNALSEGILDVESLVEGKDISRAETLTSRERQIITMISEAPDRSVYQEIREKFGIPEKKARDYLRSICNKLGVENYVQAAVVLYAYETGDASLLKTTTVNKNKLFTKCNVASAEDTVLYAIRHGIFDQEAIVAQLDLSLVDSLTARQKRILLALVQGSHVLSQKELVKELGPVLQASGATINNELSRIYKKLGVRNKMLAALYALMIKEGIPNE